MMKIKKKVLALTITLAMVLALVPLLPPQVALAAPIDVSTPAALAAELIAAPTEVIRLTTNITLADNVTLGGRHTIDLDGNNLIISGNVSGGFALFIVGSGDLTVSGSLNITLSSGGFNCLSIQDSDLLITGTVDLTITGEGGGISTGGSVTITGGTLIYGGEFEGIFADGNVTINNGSNIDINSVAGNGIKAEGTVAINGGSGTIAGAGDGEADGSGAAVAAGTNLTVGPNTTVWDLGKAYLTEIHEIFDYYHFFSGAPGSVETVLGTIVFETVVPTPTPEPAPAPAAVEETTPVSPKTGDPGSSLLYVLMALSTGGMTFAGIKAVTTKRKT